MSDFDDGDPLEATEEQLVLLRELGVAERELEGLSFVSADEWIAELKAQREDAGKYEDI